MRRLLLVRHGIAHRRDARRWPRDADRPLTGNGKERFARTARRLRDVVRRPAAVFTSPLKRARQTARILAREARFPKPTKMLELRPGRGARSVIAALRKTRKKYMAVVGHEPDLSELTSELLVGSQTLKGRLKKGGIVLLELDEFAPGKARLCAYSPPRLLRGRKS